MKYQNATNKMTQFVTVKSLIWPWGHSSRSKVIINGTWHIMWKWSTYMPNMKSLSWTTKKLQPGHDLLRTHGPVWHWGQSSRSKVIINGTRHIVWRWFTYMPNMKSLSWTTKIYSPDTICYGRRTDKLITIGRLPLCAGDLMKYTTSYLDLHSEFKMRAD